MNNYNEDNLQKFTRPTLDYYICKNYWSFLTKGMSAEEVTDFEHTRHTLQHYNRIFSIVEYTSDLHLNMIALQLRVMTLNPSMPQNIYRACGANSVDNLFPEIEAHLKAYYDLMDDCKDFPHWQRKLEEDFGQASSMLAVMLEEATRDGVVERSEVLKRFDMEKQKYFK